MGLLFTSSTLFTGRLRAAPPCGAPDSRGLAPAVVHARSERHIYSRTAPFSQCLCQRDPRICGALPEVSFTASMEVSSAFRISSLQVPKLSFSPTSGTRWR